MIYNTFFPFLGPIFLGALQVAAFPGSAGSSTATSADSTSTGSSSGGASNARLTFYNGGGALGSCGNPVNDNDMTVAMNAADYQAAWCGKSISITVGSKTVTATIEDKCPGCPKGGLDLTPAVFDQLGNAAQGVLTGSWSFSDGSGSGSSSAATGGSTSSSGASGTSTDGQTGQTGSATSTGVGSPSTSTGVSSSSSGHGEQSGSNGNIPFSTWGTGGSSSGTNNHWGSPTSSAGEVLSSCACAQ